VNWALLGVALAGAVTAAVVGLKPDGEATPDGCATPDGAFVGADVGALLAGTDGALVGLLAGGAGALLAGTDGAEEGLLLAGGAGALLAGDEAGLLTGTDGAAVTVMMEVM
jgi:hypothetical protein